MRAQIAEYQRIVQKLDPAIRLYNVPGNHDVGNTPTPATVAAYVRAIGPDHYAFRHAGLYGIVINSALMSDPSGAADLLAAQDAWLGDRTGPRPCRRREAHRPLRAPLICS